MDPRIRPLTDILRLNTRLFRNCLDGISDEQATLRPSASTNSAAFVAAHVADARFYLLRVLGTDQPSPLAAYLKGAKGIDDLKTSPPLELDAPVKTPFPIADPTTLSVLTFLVQHDTYHIGQFALLRKHAGLPAMQYT
jgi:uncharacterized damage-inducible protein DinB